MADYCSEIQVKRWLPSGYSVTVLPDATITTVITETSAMIDDRLPRYWPFPAHDAATPTPKTIQELTTWLAAYECLHILGMSDRYSEDSLTWKLRKWAEDRIALVHAGDIRISPVTQTDAMTFGTSPLDTDEFLTSIAPKEIIKGSPRISGYEAGEDFTSYWSEPNRGWIIQRFNSAIVDTTNVVYEYTYQKQREIDTKSFRSGVIYRA